MRRVAHGFVVTGVALAVVGGGAPALGAGPGAGALAECLPGATLAAADLPSRLAAGDCDVEGMTVTDGAASVLVPARGLSVTAAVLTQRGTDLLTVSRTAAGAVTVRRGAPAVPATSSSAAASGCTSSAFVDLGYQVRGTYSWRYNAAKAPRNVSGAALGALKTATGAMASGKDDCGIAGQPRVGQAYAGSTNAAPGFTSAGNCAPSPDRVNVTGWGALSSSGVLASTCTYSLTSSGDVVDSDAIINTNFTWTTTKAGCNGAYDLTGVMTHERGHTFGLGHPAATAANGGLTMYPSVRACDFTKRTLGRGDVLGMFRIYGKA